MVWLSEVGRFHGAKRWRRLVQRRLKLLIELAEDVKETNPELAKHYVRLVQRIVKRTRVRLPDGFRYRFCRRCATPFHFGVNSRVRLRRVGRYSSLIVTCSCGHRSKLVWKRRMRRE
ncbi:MAG: ribonuclease P [Promethearchaeota archaeon]